MPVIESANRSSFRELVALCKQNLPRCDERLLKKAYEFASMAHSEESRQSEEPYLTHPLAVAKILASEIPFDDVSVAAALLHDVLENNKEISPAMIRKEFGQELELIVSGLTKVQNIFKGSEIDKSENYRRLLMSVTRDIRVIIVKFADRLHNMRTLEFLLPDKRKRISQETMEIYAPLAHRFGLGKIKWELEDLAFKELNRQAYEELKRKINAKRDEREEYIQKFTAPIIERLMEYGSGYELSGRVKHLYSIYRKMIKRNKPFEEIYDLLAIRVLLDDPDPNKCYMVFGLINNIYNPVPDRFKDYIAMPKANNYQSIHTTVIGPEGKHVEVQIRTGRMHEIAEQGVAAHWRYKEGKADGDKTIDQYVNWIRDLLDNSGSDDLRHNIIENFRLNLYNDEIYVFTPKGDLKRLPAGSTAVDFAFAVHSKVGFHCVGAKVNQRMMPLDTVLHSGDQVDILTSKNQHPNKNWLKFVRTHKAKQDIRKWINKEDQEIVQKGKDFWDKKLKKIRRTFASDELVKFVHEQKFANTRQFFRAIGQGKVDVDELLKVNDEREKKLKENAKTYEAFVSYARSSAGSLVVNGLESDLTVTYAKCCNPIPGDPVVGFITIGEGVKIHRKTCKNLEDISKKSPDRIVSIQWPQIESSAFIAGLHIFGEDSPGILNEIAHSIVSYQNTNIKSINIDAQDSFFAGTVTLFVRDTEHLTRIIDRLKKLKGVSSVSRLEAT